MPAMAAGQCGLLVPLPRAPLGSMPTLPLWLCERADPFAGRLARGRRASRLALRSRVTGHSARRQLMDSLLPFFFFVAADFYACMKGYEGFWSGPDYTTRPPVLSCAASARLATPGMAACCRHPHPDTRARVSAVERRPWRSTMPSARHSRGPCLLRPAARPPTGCSTTCVPSQTWRRAGRQVGLEMRGPEPDRAPNRGLHHSIGLPLPPQVR